MKQTRRLLAVLLAVTMLFCVVPMISSSAWNGGGIYNNGLGGININIYQYPYTADGWNKDPFP